MIGSWDAKPRLSIVSIKFQVLGNGCPRGDVAEFKPLCQLGTTLDHMSNDVGRDAESRLSVVSIRHRALLWLMPFLPEVESEKNANSLESSFSLDTKITEDIKNQNQVNL